MVMMRANTRGARGNLRPSEEVAPLDDFRNVTLDWIHEMLEAVNQDWQDVNRDLYDGEHWSPGGFETSGWVGPRPPLDDPGYGEVMSAIETGFVSSNKVREIVDRLVNAALSREPNWGMSLIRPLADGETPTDQEQQLIDEAESMLTEWWDTRKVLGMWQQVLQTASLEERGSLRLYIPRSRMRRFTSPEDAMRNLFVHHCRPGQAMVYRDEQTMDEMGIYAYTVREQERAEVTWLEGDITILRFLGTVQEADAQSTAAPGYTRIVGANGLPIDETMQEFRLDLGGRTTIYEIQRSLLITPQVRSAQFLLNKALTMMSRNLDTGGFLERTVLNGQLPGHYEDSEDSPTGRVWVPDPYKMGAGMTTYIAGIEQVDNNTGQSSLTTPSLVYRDPVSIATFEETRKAAYLSMLEEVQQLHVAIAGDATTSGESRRQAMAAFVSDLRQTKSIVDGGLRWTLEAALAVAAFFGGQPGRYNSLRAVADTRIDPGPLPADEMSLITARYEARLLSRPTAMSLQGVDDVDAEIALIETDTSGDLGFGTTSDAGAAPDVPTVPGIDNAGDPGVTGDLAAVLA